MKYPLVPKKIYLPLMIIEKNVEKKKIVTCTKEIQNKCQKYINMLCPIFIRKNF